MRMSVIGTGYFGATHAAAMDRMGVLIAPFKPNSDDIRESPALDSAFGVQKVGTAVRVYHPVDMDNARRYDPTLAYEDSALGACRDADVVLHLTRWHELCDFGPTELGAW